MRHTALTVPERKFALAVWRSVEGPFYEREGTFTCCTLMTAPGRFLPIGRLTAASDCLGSHDYS